MRQRLKATRVPRRRWRAGALAAALLAAAPAFAAGASATKLVPIVLDVAGVGAARYTTELTLVNRGTTAASIDLTYTPAASLGASGGGTVTVSLAAGRELVLPDTLTYLRARGLRIPTDTNQGGTLLATFSGLSAPDAAYAGARTTTPSGTGRAGLSYAGVDLGAAAAGPTFLYGLRSTSGDRTNLALANASASAAVTLRVTLFSGAAGDGRSFTVSPDTTLGPLQWTQIGRVMDLAGFVNGWAKVEIVSGPGPYVAYAVFNDNTTNDGSYVSAERAVLAPEPRLLPVLVESASFQSELVLTNPMALPQSAVLTYVESEAPASGAGGSLTVSLAPGEQRIIPGALDFLRQHGVAIGPKGPTYAGALSVAFRKGGSASNGFAGARTSAPAGGAGPGEYGVFYPAIGATYAALTDAWVYGLRQDASNRSNLAVANLGDSGDPITIRADVYDGATGLLAGSTPPATLAPGGWTQLDAVLQAFGVADGYVRVVKLSGSDRFLAYGVVNDGGGPGEGTSDGSFVAGQPASSVSIASISVCESGTGPGAGCVDSHRLVLGPAGNVINENGVHGISDEHASILPPGAAGDNADYLLFAASGTSVNPDIGVVVLSLGTGPNASGQWSANFAAGYGDYGTDGFGTVFLAPVVQGRCPNAANAAAQDQTFDLGYAAAGSVLVDPTQPPGQLLMLYEGANGCVGTTGGPSPGSAYITAGLATSHDGGRTWPTYRATPTFSFVALPKASRTQGPAAPFGATGAAVCMGNDCSVTPSASEGRYPALTVPTTLDSLMKAARPLSGGLGDSEPAAFVDDVAAGPGSTPWVYALHQYLPGDGSLPDGRTGDLSLARARLEGGASTLSFAKWDGHAFAAPGVGGVEASILPDGPFQSCGATGQSRSEASISYVDETRQYLLLFVCSSLGDPATGPGTGHGTAWFWSTSDDLSDPSRWSTPQQVSGTWQVWDTGTPPGSYGCPSYEGWYPSLMSPGRATGHLSTNAFAFYMTGCLGGSNGNPPKRQYSSRRFTITTAPAGAGGGE